MVRILFIALTFFAFSGRAVTSGDWIYNIISDSDPSVPRVAQITGYNGPDGDVSIPSSIDGIPITIIGIGQMSQPVFNSTSVVTTIAISSGIKVIENWAFYGYTNLKRITFPDTITNIGHSAFDGCSGLEEVTIPASLTGISYFAFNNCSNLADFFVSPLNPYY